MRVINSLCKGIQILEYIASDKNGVKMSDISRHFEIPTSNLTLFLNSLIQMGYVIKNQFDGKYYMSKRIKELAANVRSDVYKDLKMIAHSELVMLNEFFHENVLLGILNQYQLEFIDRIQSDHRIQIINNEHLNYTPHVTAAGKAILAFLSAGQLDDYFKNVKLEKYTPKSIVKKKSIVCEFGKVKELGYAVNVGEYEEQIMAVAAPVFYGDKVIASVAVQFPAFRFKESELADKAELIVTSALKISKEFSKTDGGSQKNTTSKINT